MDNIDIIRQEIKRKNDYTHPYYGTKSVAEKIITDQDHFPYTRYYRGEYKNPNLVVMEREAGWSPLRNECYRKLYIPVKTQHRQCWQYPCSTIFPCVPGKHVPPSDAENVTNDGECKVKNFNVAP